MRRRGGGQEETKADAGTTLGCDEHFDEFRDPLASNFRVKIGHRASDAGVGVKAAVKRMAPTTAQARVDEVRGSSKANAAIIVQALVKEGIDPFELGAMAGRIRAAHTGLVIAAGPALEESVGYNGDMIIKPITRDDGRQVLQFVMTFQTPEVETAKLLLSHLTGEVEVAIDRTFRSILNCTSLREAVPEEGLAAVQLCLDRKLGRSDGDLLAAMKAAAAGSPSTSDMIKTAVTIMKLLRFQADEAHWHELRSMIPQSGSFKLDGKPCSLGDALKAFLPSLGYQSVTGFTDALGSTLDSMLSLEAVSAGYESQLMCTFSNFDLFSALPMSSEYLTGELESPILSYRELSDYSPTPGEDGSKSITGSLIVTGKGDKAAASDERVDINLSMQHTTLENVRKAQKALSAHKAGVRSKVTAVFELGTRRRANILQRIELAGRTAVYSMLAALVRWVGPKTFGDYNNDLKITSAGWRIGSCMRASISMSMPTYDLREMLPREEDSGSLSASMSVDWNKEGIRGWGTLTLAEARANATIKPDKWLASPTCSAWQRQWLHLGATFPNVEATAELEKLQHVQKLIMDQTSIVRALNDYEAMLADVSSNRIVWWIMRLLWSSLYVPRRAALITERPPTISQIKITGEVAPKVDTGNSLGFGLAFVVCTVSTVYFLYRIFG